MLCLLFFCRFVFMFGKGDRADQKSRPRKSEEPLVQGGERGTAERRASYFLYVEKDACAKRRKWRGLHRFPFPLYYFGKATAQSGENGAGCAVPLLFTIL